MYQPATAQGICGWHAARLLASLGAFRMFPRAAPPPAAVLEALAPHISGVRHVAVSPRPNHPGRHVALILRTDGSCEMVAKVASVDGEREMLAAEVKALQDVAPQLPAPLSAPAVQAFDGDVLLFRAVDWRPRLRPWVLPEEVASAMGAFFKQGSGRSPSHGDFTPWNLLRTDDGWVLLDWEEVTAEGLAFFDVLHYLVQGHALLGHPSRRTLLRGLDGAGWVGTALRAYADAAGLDAAQARPALVAYLGWSLLRQDRDADRRWRGRQVREELLGALGS
jgi:hypothetical protein